MEKRLRYFLILFFVPPLLTLFFTSTNLMDGLQSGKLFYFYFISSATLILISLMGLFYKKSINVHLQYLDYWILLFFIWIIFSIGFKEEISFADNYFIRWVLLTIYYLLWKTIFRNADHKIHRVIFALFLGVGLVEGLYGFGQLYRVIPDATIFSVTGHFGNPDHFAGYIASITPFAFGMFYLHKNSKQLNNNYLFYIGISTSLICLLVLSGTLIRGAWISTGCGVGFILLNKHWKLITSTAFDFSKLRKSVVVGTIFVILGFASIGLYQMKPDSVDGRLLIWKVTVQTIKEAPIFGHGFNSYATVHNRSQAKYFLENATTEREKILAGNVEHAHNEYLQIFSELGVVGFILFFGIIFAAFRKRETIKPSHKRNGFCFNKRLTVCAKGSLIATLISSLFSFPLHILPTLIHFFFLLAVISAFDSKKKKSTLNVPDGYVKIISLFAVLFSLWFFIYAREQYEAYKEWNKAFHLAQMSNWNDSLFKYESIYPVLNSNGKFLFTYGGTMVAAERFDEAIPMLELSRKNYSNPSLFLALAEAWHGVGKIDKAAEYYRYSWQIIPHKMYPLYRLVMLKKDAKKFNEAILWAKKIVQMEEKVPSRATNQIKFEMEAFIQEYDFND